MYNKFVKTAIVCLLILSFNIAPNYVNACHFYFNHESISAPLGTTGRISVRVLQDHNDCSLSDGLDGYMFETELIQVLHATEWKQIAPMLFERTFTVTLSNIGTGYFRIWKDCDREGYGGDEIPITVLQGDTLWRSAFSGTYPYAEPPGVKSIQGSLSGEEKAGILKTLDISFPVDNVPLEVLNYSDNVTLFYDIDTAEIILVVSEEFYYRFDQL